MPETKTEQFMIRLSPSEKRQLLSVAKAEKRSASDTIRLLIFHAYEAKRAEKVSK